MAHTVVSVFIQSIVYRTCTIGSYYVLITPVSRVAFTIGMCQSSSPVVYHMQIKDSQQYQSAHPCHVLCVT